MALKVRSKFILTLWMLPCMLSTALWGWSYHRAESWDRITPSLVDDLTTSRGLILLHRGRLDRPDPQQQPRLMYSPMAPYDLDELLCGPTAAWNHTEFHCVSSYDPTNGIRYNEVTIPCWSLVALTAIFPAASMLARYRRFRIRRRLPTACPFCGYDLRATPNQCPECGRAPQSP